MLNFEFHPSFNFILTFFLNIFFFSSPLFVYLLIYLISIFGREQFLSNSILILDLVFAGTETIQVISRSSFERSTNNGNDWNNRRWRCQEVLKRPSDYDPIIGIGTVGARHDRSVNTVSRIDIRILCGDIRGNTHRINNSERAERAGSNAFRMNIKVPLCLHAVLFVRLSFHPYRPPIRLQHFHPSSLVIRIVF